MKSQQSTVAFTLSTLVTETNESYAPLLHLVFFLMVYLKILFSGFSLLNFFPNYQESCFTFRQCIWTAYVYVSYRPQTSTRNASKCECTSSGRELPTSKNSTWIFNLVFHHSKLIFQFISIDILDQIFSNFLDSCSQTCAFWSGKHFLLVYVLRL